jgi:uncharacterized protein
MSLVMMARQEEAANITQFSQGAVRGFLHRPVEATQAAGAVLTHGASGNSKAPLLVEVARAFCDAGFWVLRCDLPFRQRRPFGPPSPHSAAGDRAGLAEAIQALRSFAPGPIILGGHSYGGRQASMLAAEVPGCATALVLLSYPLHPPGKPEQVRTAHLSTLETPALFVHGTRDPFGSIEEMTAAMRLIPARTRLVSIEGAGHDLRRGKFDITRFVVEEIRALI